MGILLGNLSIKQIEERMGIVFPESLKTRMANCHQENVSSPINNGNWHCFDLPFTLVCGDMELAQMIYDNLSPYIKDIKKPLHIALERGNS